MPTLYAETAREWLEKARSIAELTSVAMEDKAIPHNTWVKIMRANMTANHLIGGMNWQFVGDVDEVERIGAPTSDAPVLAEQAA